MQIGLVLTNLVFLLDLCLRVGLHSGAVTAGMSTNLIGNARNCR